MGGVVVHFEIRPIEIDRRLMMDAEATPKGDFVELGSRDPEIAGH